MILTTFRHQEIEYLKEQIEHLEHRIEHLNRVIALQDTNAKELKQHNAELRESLNSRSKQVGEFAEQFALVRALMVWALKHIIRPLLVCSWCNARRASDLSGPLKHDPECPYDRATKFAEGGSIE